MNKAVVGNDGSNGFDLRTHACAGPLGDMAGPSLRVMSVQAALHWAFAVEQVSIEFDEFAGPSGTDTIWHLMRRGLLGCKVDGGGVTPRHDDAEVIASVVAQLSAGQGGPGMAITVAALARAGMVPDWMPGAAPRCVPVDTRLTKHGLFARTEVVGEVVVRHRGRPVTHQMLACPVTYRPSGAQIASARRAYLDWWGALLHIASDLRACNLRTISISSDMPPMTPWRKRD